MEEVKTVQDQVEEEVAEAVVNTILTTRVKIETIPSLDSLYLVKLTRGDRIRIDRELLKHRNILKEERDENGDQIYLSTYQINALVVKEAEAFGLNCIQSVIDQPSYVVKAQRLELRRDMIITRFSQAQAIQFKMRLDNLAPEQVLKLIGEKMDDIQLPEMDKLVAIKKLLSISIQPEEMEEKQYREKIRDIRKIISEKGKSSEEKYEKIAELVPQKLLVSDRHIDPQLSIENYQALLEQFVSKEERQFLDDMRIIDEIRENLSDRCSLEREVKQIEFDLEVMASATKEDGNPYFDNIQEIHNLPNEEAWMLYAESSNFQRQTSDFLSGLQ